MQPYRLIHTYAVAVAQLCVVLYSYVVDVNNYSA